jgi:hypothetical protein
MSTEHYPYYYIDYGCHHFWVEYSRVRFTNCDHIYSQCINCQALKMEDEPVLYTYTYTDLWSMTG